MAGQEGYTYEEMFGAAAPAKGGGTPAAVSSPIEEEAAPLVFADRTTKKKQRPHVTMEEMGGSSAQRGELPKDPQMRDNIRAAAKARGVPEELLYALIQQESGYNPNAHNDETDAHGLAQYIPASAKARNLDPSDPIASLAWAAKDLKEQMDAGGLDWAIKHHFAGPNTAGHGPKTRQYLADVKKRMDDIRAQMEAEGETVASAQLGNVVAGGSDVAAGVRPPTKEETGYTFDEMFGKASAPPKDIEGDEISEVLVGTAKEIGGQFTRQADRIWRATKRRFSSEGKKTVQMSPAEIDEAIEGMTPADAKRVRENYEYVFPKVDTAIAARTGLGLSADPNQKKTATIQEPTAEDIKDAPRKQAEYEARQALKGFMNNLESPVKTMLEDSLPANVIESITNEPDFNYQKMQEAAAIRQQYDMVKNPTKYPPAQVAEARQAIAERAKPKDRLAFWNDLKKAAADDPSGLAAKFVNAITADPYLMAVPAGSGLKGLTATKAVAQGIGVLPKTGRIANVAEKAAKIGDKLVDPALTGGVTNIAIEAGAAASEGEEITGDQALVAGLTGALPAGFIGGLSSVPLLRGFRVAREKVFGAKAAGKPLTEDMLTETMPGAAAEDALREKIIIQPNWLERMKLAPDVKARIEAELGIENLTPAQRKAKLQAEREKWKQVFEGTDLEARFTNEYPEALQRARESLAASERKAAEAARREALTKRTEDDLAARHQEIEDNYTEALAARERARELGDEEAAHAENDVRDAMTKLDEEEIYRAAVEADAPAVRRAMNNAARRDSQLARPKWQRGEIDPELLAKMGVGSLFAGTAYAISPEDDKVRNAVTAAMFTLGAGRAGRAVGRAGRRVHAASVENPFNFIYQDLIKKKLLKPQRSLDETLARDTELVEQAKLGKSDAIKELFDEHYQGLVTAARRYTKGNQADAEDLVQGAFARVFSDIEGEPRINQYNPDMPFRVWMNTVVANRGKNAMEAASAEKRGGGVEHEPLTKTKVNQYGEDIVEDVTARATDMDEVLSPEDLLVQQQRGKALAAAVKNLPEKHQLVFLMSHMEGKTQMEIAEATGIPLGTVASIIARTQEKLAKVMDDFEKAVPAKGIKGPRSQRGSASQELVMKGGAVAVASLSAAALANRLNQLPDDEMIQPGEPGYRDPVSAAVGTALITSLIMFGGGNKAIRSFQKTVVEGNVVPISTRVLKKAAPVFKIAQEFEMRVKQRSHGALEKTAPFIKELRRMPAESRDIFVRALMTGNKKVIDNMLEAYNNPKLTASYKDVRSVLDSLGDQLKALNRFSPDQKFEYFPRLVKDVEGLLKAIESDKAVDLKAKLEEADALSRKRNGRPLSETETARIVNRELFGPDQMSGQHGWAKNRGVEEITPELQQYYHTPEEALSKYINSAVTDTELAKLFGKSAHNKQAGGYDYLDLETSISSMMGDMVKAGKMTVADADEVADMFKSRFGRGEQLEADWIRRIKDVGNAGMLGNLWSASSNLIDIGVQALYVQGMRSTVGALVRQATGRKLISMKDFGLTHISEEFSSPIGTTKWVNRWLRLNLFNFFDAVGKNNALNGAMLTGRRLAQTESGVAKLHQKYGEIYGDDFAKLASDLKNGKRTPDTDLYAWMELSRTQPISKLEMPQNYLNNPNLRAAWWMKSFTIKQMDLIHRDMMTDIRAGRVGQGVRKGIQAGIAMGLSGASVRYVQEWLKTGEPPPDAGWGDVPLNMFRNLGFSEYTLKDLLGVSPREAAERRDAGEEGVRATKAIPLEGVMKMAVPPYRMYQDMITGKPEVFKRAIPWISPWILEQSRQTEQELRGEDE